MVKRDVGKALVMHSTSYQSLLRSLSSSPESSSSASVSDSTDESLATLLRAQTDLPKVQE